VNIKNTFKNLVVSVADTKFIQRYIGKQTENLATIFMLHRMKIGIPKYGGHSPEFLESALQYLKDNDYNFVSVENLLQRALTGAEPIKKAVAFTMDDGYHDQANIALPIFVKFNCPITVFLISGFIDKQVLPWDTVVKYCFYESICNTLTLTIGNENITYDLSNINRRTASMRNFREKCKSLNESELKIAIDLLSNNSNVDISKDTIEYSIPLSWEEAREAESSPEVRFGVHTVSHPILSRISTLRSKEEISNSWDKISTELKNPVKIFAFPIGHYDDFLLRDIDILKQHDYMGAVTAEPGYFDQHDMISNNYARYMIKRFSFPDNIPDLMQYCSGLELIKNKLRNNYAFSIWSHKRYLLNNIFYIFYLYAGLYKKYKEINWTKINRLIFICKGNICRSPYAEYKSKKLGLMASSVGIDSDGKSNADEMAMKIAAQRGVDISPHKSRKIDHIEYCESDLIVCMEPWHAEAILNNQILTGTNCQLTLLGLWCSNRKALIRDPYGQSTEIFLDSFNLIDDALSIIHKKLDTLVAG